MIGAETASYLCVQCKEKVTIVEMLPDIANDMEGGIRDDLKDVLNKYFVKILTKTKLAGVTEQGALLDTGCETILYPCDTVVLAIGTKAYNPLEEELRAVRNGCRRRRNHSQKSRQGCPGRLCGRDERLSVGLRAVPPAPGERRAGYPAGGFIRYGMQKGGRCFTKRTKRQNGISIIHSRR